MLRRIVNVERRLVESSPQDADRLTNFAKDCGSLKLRLVEVLSRLPDEYRDVIILRNLEGLSREDVSVRMNRSVGAVRMLWVLALACLRKNFSVVWTYPRFVGARKRAYHDS